jgi:hypothetical protein
MVDVNPTDFTDEDKANLLEIALNSDKFNTMSVFEKRKFVSDWIQAFPERHNQQQWISGEIDVENYAAVECGTACCVAGWAVAFSGLKVNENSWDSYGGEGYRCVHDADGNEWHVANKAREILDLSPGQGNRLFEGQNSREFIVGYLDTLNKGEE